MNNEIIPYLEMCSREGVSLQKGMNFQVKHTHSVILMSLRPGAPYKDAVEEDGAVLIYEGHDVQRRDGGPDPKTVDQPEVLPSGRLTDNGTFHKAAQDFRQGTRDPERVRVYEKLRDGIWSYNGMFHLTDSWREVADDRKVFRFRLEPVEGEEDLSLPVPKEVVVRRVIPTATKLEVWRRDGGKCVTCGVTTDLHFDHIIPWSRGGSSTDPSNIQILCGRHNIQKSHRIQ